MEVFAFFSRLIAVFSVVMMFGVSGWAETPDVGNSCVLASTVNANSTTNTLAINPSSDMDYFKIVLTQAGTLSLSSTAATHDVVGRLYDSSCTQLASNTGNNNFSISQNLSAGTYYVSIEDSGKNQTSTYNFVSAFVAASANLALTNTDAPDPVTINGTLVYTLNVTNGGPNTATDLILTDTLPSGVIYQSAIGAGWSCNQVAGVVTCTNANLTNGSSSSVAITLTAPSAVGTITNTATVTSAATDPTPANNTNIAQSTTVQLPTISINDVSIFEGSNGSTRLMTFTVSISPSASGAINYATSNGTATAGSDYGSTSGMITFVAGEVTSRDIQVPIYGDAISEGTETFNLTLSNPSGFTILKSVGVGTIYDYGNTIFRNGERDFELRNPQETRNKTGDVLVVGNTVQCVTDNSSSFGGNCTTNLSRTANDYYTKYLNSDTNTTTFNSSSATLAGIPVGAKVIWAGLYWEGFLHQCNSTNATSCRYRYSNSVAPSPLVTVSSDNLNLSSSSLNAQNVYVDIPNNSIEGYQQVTASMLDYRYVSDATGTVYSAFLEITDLINTTNANGVYTVANIQSMEGERGWGNFGAWSLFVIYEDLSKTAILRNMSIYDGFKTVNSSSSTWATIPLSGFMTPTRGVVDSKLISFAGEGEYAYSPDRISIGGDTNYLSNAENPNDNVFNSTIAGFTRNPSYSNANGIDIDIFDVSGFMHNTQTSSTVKMTSGLDAYYPSVLGFSTQLYAPDVCYGEDIFYNGQRVSSSNIPESGRDIDITVMITNKDNEPAQGVFIEKVFANPAQQLAYKPASMLIRPIGSTIFSTKTDTLYDDTAEYASSTAKFLLGAGASASTGGTINKNDETQFSYSSTVGTDQNISENVYLVSYRNDYLKISFRGIPIRKCADFNNTFGVYIPVIGKFNTVRSGAVNVAGGETDPIDPIDSKNALYTQIVNKPFNVDILSFSNDNITPTAPSTAVDLNLTMVELTPDGNCTDSNLSAMYPLHFATTDKYKTATVLPVKVSQNAAFHMVTNTANLCSRDRFSIRPASYKMDANETQLVGNRMYQFTVTAGEYSSPSTPSLAYNQEVYNGVDKNATTQLVVPVGCALASPIEIINNPLPFSNGQVTALVLYPNIGDINFTVSDQQWSAGSQDQAKGDCNLNSAENVSDGSGKVGCMTQSSQIFSFTPALFENTMNIINNNGSFTYVSSNSEMNASVNLSIKAVMDNNSTATNYTKNCFARDVDYTVRLNNNQVLAWSDTQHRIHFYPDNNTTYLSSSTPPEVMWVTGQESFSSGIANTKFYVNFDRNQTIPDSSFTVARNDFNITTMLDQNNTSGLDFDRASDHNITFLYGRLIPRDVRVFGDGSTFSTNAWYEVYNTADINGTALAPSQNDAMWYTNRLHNDINEGDGNVTVVIVGTNPTNTSPNVISGIEAYGFTNYPLGSYKAHILTAPWLWYGAIALPYSDPIDPTNLDCLTHPCFNINVVPPKAATGSAKSSEDAEKKANKATTTEGGGLIYDYAPAIQ